jgi:hypothetical protein
MKEQEKKILGFMSILSIPPKSSAIRNDGEYVGQEHLLEQADHNQRSCKNSGLTSIST